MLNLTYPNDETPLSRRSAAAACDAGLDHGHLWARDGRYRAQGIRPAQPQAVRVPSTVLHDDIHYA